MLVPHPESMNESQTRLLSLRDEAIPALPSILGPDAEAIMAAALAPQKGHIVSCRLAQVSWAPGRSLTAVFRVQAVWQTGAAAEDGHIVVSSGPDAIEGGLELADASGARITLWRLPEDPALPGLAAVSNPVRIRPLLESIGVEDAQATCTLRAYRPTRRAVVEVTAARQRLFVKVVPPSRIARLQSLHAEMAPHLPVPHSHGWSDRHGLVVLEALPGLSLRQCLLDKRQPLPDPSQLAQLLDHIPAPADKRIAVSQAGSATALAPMLCALVPDKAGEIEAIVTAFAADRPSRPEVPVHGDLHEAQLTVQDGRITGLLDIDTAGMGERIDDWATLLGHLALLQDAVPPPAHERIRAFAVQLMALADHQVEDPARLRLRIATVILGLASGPFRVQTQAWVPETRRRIDLAGRWLENARRHAADESVLSQP